MGSEHPVEDATRAIPVEFRSTAGNDANDGPVLRGERFGAGERWVVLVHDVGKDLDAWRQLPAWLAGRGLSVLTFDLPGHGASDEPWDPMFAPSAVMAAVEFARAKGARQIHVVAERVGALAALAAAAGGAHDIASVAALSPQADDRVAQASEVREARVPKLILIGSFGPAAMTRFAEVVYRRAIGPCEMARFPVAAQGADLLNGDWGQQVREKILAHVSRQA